MPSDTRRRPHLAEIATDLIDDQVGIVRLAGAAPRQPGSPSFFHYWALAADTRAFAEQHNFARTGGAAEDPDRALAKAIGEAVERYCAAIYTQEELPLRTADEAEFPVVEPATFALNSAAQYAEEGFWLVPFERETAVRWTPAVDGVSGETRYVPAAMVYVPYYYEPDRGEPAIAQPISTGLSCHASFHEAAAVSLGEVVERDAFTIVWQAKIAPPRIAVHTLPAALGRLHGRFGSAGFDVTLFDITLDNRIPTVLAVSRHRSPECPAVVVAASASLDPARATRGALEELAHTGHYCQEIVRELPRLAPDADARRTVVDQESHLNYWCDHANAAGIGFLFAASTEIAYDELEGAGTGSAADDLRELCRRIAATGHRPLLCDLTTPDVADLGLAVVRAVVPGYHPLVSGHRYRALGGRRLWEVPQRLGHRGISPRHGDNPLPHPYP
jgi:ribosomal protein S12 methylthiotransferase accessory factor